MSRLSPLRAAPRALGHGMFARFLDAAGGYALRRPDLRRLYVAMFLGMLGSSIAFPLRLLYARAHGATPGQLGLIAAAFFLAPLVAQLPLGWLVDHWGRRPVLLLGMVGHALVMGCYVPFNTPVALVVLRFVEGVTVAALLPAVNAYIADVVPEEHRAEAYGGLTAVFSAGLMIGPLVGGLVGQRWGFDAAYYASVLIEAVAAGVVWGRLREPTRHALHGHTGGRVPWQRLVSLPLVGAYAVSFSAQVVGGMMTALWSIYLRDLGGSYALIGVTLTAFALPQLALGSYAGRMGGRWGRARVLGSTGLLLSLIYAAFGVSTNLLLIVLIGAVEGILLVFQQPVAQGLLADASPAAARGRAQGLAGMIAEFVVLRSETWNQVYGLAREVSRLESGILLMRQAAQLMMHVDKTPEGLKIGFQHLRDLLFRLPALETAEASESILAPEFSDEERAAVDEDDLDFDLRPQQASHLSFVEQG